MYRVLKTFRIVGVTTFILVTRYVNPTLLTLTNRIQILQPKEGMPHTDAIFFLPQLNTSYLIVWAVLAIKLFL